MLKKILSSTFILIFTSILFGTSIGNAQNPTTDFYNQKESSKVMHVAQNGNNNDINADDDDDMDWGWIGLIGLAGLLGLRRNDRK
ncbi:WGxxGxxG family protein [Bacillus sp. JJ1773]|uniref:WGxxGxxG family protein n=1 Tax=Bacillus sp. JJ1773 TaxID=3122965 RepID=UPI003000E14B